MSSMRFSVYLNTFKHAGVFAASSVFTTNTSGQRRLLVSSSSAFICGQEFVGDW
jgi:hypothetical protein